jgi:PST family polysaccharide transporter
MKIGLIITPVVTAGYVLGLPYGPRGVAIGFSVAMILLIIPTTIFGVRETVVSFRDVVGAVRRPLVSGVVAGALAFAMQFLYGQALPPIARLLLGCFILFVAYSGMLLYVMGQKAFYISLLRGLTGRPLAQPTTLVPVQ